jgi:hypothetical protein
MLLMLPQFGRRWMRLHHPEGSSNIREHGVQCLRIRLVCKPAYRSSQFNLVFFDDYTVHCIRELFLAVELARQTHHTSHFKGITGFFHTIRTNILLWKQNPGSP